MSETAVKTIPVDAGGLLIGSGRPKICIPLVGKDLQEIKEQIGLVLQAYPDIVEWRADMFEGILDEAQRSEALETISYLLGGVPILFTFRSHFEGGNKEITAEEYSLLNVWASRRKEIAMIDIEGRRGDFVPKDLVKLIHADGKPVITSAHFLDSTPSAEKMADILRELDAAEGDVLKLAVMPSEAQDVLNLMQATLWMCKETPHPVVTMAMGKLGVVSRLSGSLTGSSMTFSTAGDASAPGQLPAEIVRDILEQLDGLQGAEE